MIRRLMMTAAILIGLPAAAHAEKWVTVDISVDGQVAEYDVDSVLAYPNGARSLFASMDSNESVLFLDCKGHMASVSLEDLPPNLFNHVRSVFEHQRLDWKHYSNISIAAEFAARVCARHGATR